MATAGDMAPIRSAAQAEGGAGPCQPRMPGRLR